MSRWRSTSPPSSPATSPTRSCNRRARELYAEIGEVEEEHVTFYESLLDPTETLLQRQVQHQLMELEARDLENVVLAETKDHADWELLGQLAEQLPNGKARKAIEAAVAEVGPQEDEHLGWAQAKLAEFGLKALTQEPPPDPERLDRVVIEPDLKIKEIHAAPIDKRNLLDGAKLPSFQETPTSRASSNA